MISSFNSWILRKLWVRMIQSVILWCDCTFSWYILNFLMVFEGVWGRWKGDFEREHEIICSQFALIWSKGFEIGLPLWFYPDLAQNQRARDHALWLGRFSSLLGTVLGTFFWSRNIFYDRFPHVIFILKLKERTQRHYFCDQDQTLDIFAGARAEDSAIMMVANIRRARHSLLKLFQRDSTAPSS